MTWFGNLLDNGKGIASRIVKGSKEALEGVTKANNVTEASNIVRPPSWGTVYQRTSGDLSGEEIGSLLTSNKILNDAYGKMSDEALLKRVELNTNRTVDRKNFSSFYDMMSDTGMSVKEARQRWNSLNAKQREGVLGDLYIGENSQEYQRIYDKLTDRYVAGRNEVINRINNVSSEIQKQRSSLATPEAKNLASQEYYRKTYTNAAEQQAQSMGGSWLKYGIGGTVVTGGLVLVLNSSRGSQTNAQLYGQQPIY